MTTFRPGATRAVQQLSVVMLGAAAAAAVYAFPHAVAVRAALGLPFLLVGQGYLLSCAIFVRGQVEPSARLTLSLAFSFASMIVVGLALDVVGVAITTKALTVALVGVGFVAAVVGLVRDPRDPARGGARAALRPEVVRWTLGLGIGITIFAIALVLLARPLPNTTVAGYTQLWALRAADGSITVGVRSAHGGPQTYRVVVKAASSAGTSFTVTLQPGQTRIRWRRSWAVRSNVR